MLNIRIKGNISERFTIMIEFMSYRFDLWVRDLALGLELGFRLCLRLYFRVIVRIYV